MERIYINPFGHSKLVGGYMSKKALEFIPKSKGGA